MKAVVLIANGLNLGFLGCYGNEWVATPVLDRLAAEGITFDQHFADQPDAAGLDRAWRTGSYAFALPGETSEPAPANVFPLLKAAGVHTVLVTPRTTSAAADWARVEPFTVGPADGTPQDEALRALCRCLDEGATADAWLLRVDLATLLPPRRLPEAFLALYPETEGDLDGAGPVDLSTGEPELPGLPDPEDLTFLRLRNEYAAAVTYFDSGLGLLLDELSRRGLSEQVLLLVTAGYGQFLGTPGRKAPAEAALHEERIHIPLVARLPGKAHAGTRVAAFTQTVDLLPTLFETFGIAPPPLHGRSLLPLLTDPGGPGRPYACCGLRVDGAMEYALRTSTWGLRLPGLGLAPGRQPELFVKPDDRWEVNDVRQHHSELAEGLASVVYRFVAATRRAGALEVPELPVWEPEAAETADSPRRTEEPSSP